MDLTVLARRPLPLKFTSAGVLMASCSGRWAARLERLPHTALVELLAESCATSPKTARAANRKLAMHAPIPEWALNGVLLDADLVSHIFAACAFHEVCPLGIVCSAWQPAWREKRRQRSLKVVPCNPPSP